MEDCETVAIVGVGLIGGSIGLALQQHQLVQRVVGVGRRPSSLRKAKRHGVVTVTTTSLERGVADADLIVVCTPVEDIVERVSRVAAFCPPGALITDVGSTKAGIARQLDQRLCGGAAFVGSHPLAGSERTGPENARADLFCNRMTVITPTGRSREDQVQRLERFWKSLGSKTMRMAPQAHDRAVSLTSHATHVIAAALAAATPVGDLPLVASGWRDTTRVAAGDPELWRQILLDNGQQVLKSLDRFEKVLSKFRVALENRDEARITKLLDSGKQTRDSVGS